MIFFFLIRLGFVQLLLPFPAWGMIWRMLVFFVVMAIVSDASLSAAHHR